MKSTVESFIIPGEESQSTVEMLNGKSHSTAIDIPVHVVE